MQRAHAHTHRHTTQHIRTHSLSTNSQRTPTLPPGRSRQAELIDQYLLLWSVVLSVVLVRAQPGTLLGWVLTAGRKAMGLAIGHTVRVLEAAACAVGVPLG
jgi:hypothetical protein